MPPARDAWIATPQPLREPRLRLYVFPYAGSGSAKFRPWSRAMPEGVELALVQLPGRESRWGEPMPPTLEDLAHPLAQSLRQRADVPFALFGHSMGALLAYETARQLGPDTAPRLLLASGHRAPHLPQRLAPLHKLPEPELRTAMSRLGGTPEEVLRDEELAALFAQLFRRDVALSESYHTTQARALSCPIRAYGGVDDELATRQEIEAWREQTTGDFASRFFPGGHFFLHTAEDALLHALGEDLARFVQQ